jgi:hypothetical protein
MSMDGASVDEMALVIPLKRFMLLEHCPSHWRSLDLYVFRDEDIVFYVGQSHLAFERVWEHLRNGFKGRSVIGRFILSNWPRSLKFDIELVSSLAERFNPIRHDVSLAERELIQQMTPCFNEALNRQPTPLPARYIRPNAPLRCSRSLKKLIYEAERAVKAEERQCWMSTTASGQGQ